MVTSYKRLNGMCIALVAAALGASPGALAAEPLKPFVLAETADNGSVEEVAERVSGALEDGGFKLVGEYPVSETAHVVVATHGDLMAVAEDNPRSAYLAPVRVAITEVNGEVQVSYNNLEYFSHAYRVEQDVSAVQDELKEAIGYEHTFGSEDGLSERELRRYRYMMGMERFDAPYELGSHASSEAAMSVLEESLSSGESGVRKIYKLEIPEHDVTLYGISVREGQGAPKDASDVHKLNTVDVGEFRHTAYLPYEILVHDGTIEALHMRFRMAVHWPDLGMIGANSFMQLRRSPGVLEEVLQAVAGYEEEADDFDW
ncbi:hypothetical protein [Thioalkalivibrio sp. ALE28]|uniref:hypothetical protein n=1 Tax=Thioalkalivibrio sp. ALE28 TaxID=1158179 RepID=UPI0003A182A1|nr:hypothetical protein [Thioalkalivibrio sp. ALE28]